MPQAPSFIIPPAVFLPLRKGDAEPLYLQIARRIRQKADDGLLEAGARLPGIRTAAAALGECGKAAP